MAHGIVKGVLLAAVCEQAEKVGDLGVEQVLVGHGMAKRALEEVPARIEEAKRGAGFG